uniref:Transposase element L1Md-A101/L1Md-A102/L1Md-A2 n=1 Tax=Leptobrachium leishanense TaxID=445787 RepID=A0A8C5P9T8_9ANUR
MATQKASKKTTKAEFFTPRGVKLKEGLSTQDGGGSTQTSPGAEADPGLAQQGMEAFATRIEGLITSLSDRLTSRLDSVAADIKREIREIGDRTDKLEEKMAEQAGAHNEMAGRVEDLEEQLKGALLKLADIEDRSRRHNLKIRGVPDSVTPQALSQYVTDILQHLLPDATLDSLLFDRIHRLPKPPSAPERSPRDVLLRLHYFKPREDVLRALRTPDVLKPEYEHISIFPDLSKATLQHRRNFRPVTEALRAHGVSYRWGFPVKLLVVRNGTFHAITSVEAGTRLLKVWGMEQLGSSSPPAPLPRGSTQRLDPEWRKK